MPATRKGFPSCEYGTGVFRRDASMITAPSGGGEGESGHAEAIGWQNGEVAA